jgi:hypothetical protein
MECFLEKHHRPTLLTSFHHKQLLLLHSLILSSLYLCLRLQMYFDKSFPHPFIVLPFVKYPFVSLFVILIQLCWKLLSLCSFFWIYVWVQVYLHPFSTLLHQIVLKSGTNSSFFMWIDNIILRKPSCNWRYKSRYACTMASRAISRNSDSDR